MLKAIGQIAYQYGKYVALREKHAHSRAFERYNRLCIRYYGILCEMNAYTDEDDSILRADVRPYYEIGIKSIPTN